MEAGWCAAGSSGPPGASAEGSTGGWETWTRVHGFDLRTPHSEAAAEPSHKPEGDCQSCGPVPSQTPAGVRRGSWRHLPVWWWWPRRAVASGRCSCSSASAVAFSALPPAAALAAASRWAGWSLSASPPASCPSQSLAHQARRGPSPHSGCSADSRPCRRAPEMRAGRSQVTHRWRCLAGTLQRTSQMRRGRWVGWSLCCQSGRSLSGRTDNWARCWAWQERWQLWCPQSWAQGCQHNPGRDEAGPPALSWCLTLASPGFEAVVLTLTPTGTRGPLVPWAVTLYLYLLFRELWDTLMELNNMHLLLF